VTIGPAALAALACFGMVGAPAASADDCAYDAATKTVTVSHTLTTSITIVRDGQAITARNSIGALPCGEATVRNTDAIAVLNTSGTPDAIDLGGGAFAPGATREPAGRSEIDFQVTGNGRDDLMIIGSQSGRNRVTAGNGVGDTATSGAINLDGDDDADINFTRVHMLQVYGGPLSDVFSAAGGAGTGAPAHAALVFNGATGPFSTSRGDTLIGGAGLSSLIGAGGGDTLIAGTGASFISGFGGNDRIDAANGVVDLTVNGGDGVDRATLDCGLGETATQVERATCD
jgi:Ca2+-binding RTX toxin-like protein